MRERKGETMNYFEAISHRADELNVEGQSYLDRLPFMDNEAVCERLYELAVEIDEQPGENPDWVDSTLDGHIPFGSVPRNGSLFFTMGFAVSANDARLRNLLEAMSCNLPVVARRFGALPTVLAEGDGLVFVDDERALIHKVREITGSRSMPMTRQQAVAYSWENIARRLERIYAELLLSP